MKKTYQAPKTLCVTLKGRVTIMAGSPTTEGLTSHGGYGGDAEGIEADSRQGSFWDDEE